MNTDQKPHLILGNGASRPKDDREPLILHYLNGQPGRQIKVGLPSFVRDLLHIPPRTLDLLEIAAYVFAADRWISRGPKNAIEYQQWPRALEFHIRVRDYDFWSNGSVMEQLSEALIFMTGDASIEFFFEPGHSTPPSNLFDRPGFSLSQTEPKPIITLFSGGIDSLTGALSCLTNTENEVCLVSHQSQAGTTRTQRALASVLKEKFQNRVFHYQFECKLREIRAVEETQRTRSFLYSSIAYAIATAYQTDEFLIYENGVTGINLNRREDLANARASRTTHPQTIGKLSRLYSTILGSVFNIRMPYLNCTKREVIEKILDKAPDLLSSTVSCSRTFQTEGQATHCGCCFQCIDRRIAVYAAKAEGLDHRGLYSHDIICDSIDDREARTMAIDYVRQAKRFAGWSIDQFEQEYLSGLAELLDYIPEGSSDADKINLIWNLLQRHGNDVHYGLERARQVHDNIYQPLPTYSLLGLVSTREHLKTEVQRLAESIIGIVSTAIPEMFARNLPKDEPDLNSKLGALLRSHESKIRSEHPTVSFACARVVPDHLIIKSDLLIEAKYIRVGTSPSKANEGIAADLTKYPDTAFIVFIVYDPEHAIPSDEVFRQDIQAKGRNLVLIAR